MSGYQINEKDIETALRGLRLHDPDTANRQSAIQLLEYLHALGKGAANAGPEFIKAFLEELERKKKEFKELEKRLEDEEKEGE